MHVKRVRLWLHRLRCIRIKGFRRKSSSNTKKSRNPLSTCRFPQVPTVLEPGSVPMRLRASYRMLPISGLSSSATSIRPNHSVVPFVCSIGCMASIRKAKRTFQTWVKPRAKDEPTLADKKSRVKWVGHCRCLILNEGKNSVKTSKTMKREKEETKKSLPTEGVASQAMDGDGTSIFKRPSLEQSLSLTNDDNFFTSTEKGRNSTASSITSSEICSKLSYQSFDGTMDRLVCGFQGENCEPKRSDHSTCFSLNSLYSNHTQHNEMHDSDKEEEPLVRCMSYSSYCDGDTASNGDENDMGLVCNTTDQEANAKAWEFAGWIPTTKHGTDGGRRRNKPESASAIQIRQKYWQDFGVYGRSIEKKTPLLPWEVSNSVAEDKDAADTFLAAAIEKKSHDPYVDFRDSMIDVILENQIYDAQHLGMLLQCYLSLNAAEHHNIIIQAFTEVWERVYGVVMSPLQASSVDLP